MSHRNRRELPTVRRTDSQDHKLSRPMYLPYKIYGQSNLNPIPYRFSTWPFSQILCMTMTCCTLYWSIAVTGLLKLSVLSLKRYILALRSAARNTHLFLRTWSAFLPMTICQTWLAERWGCWFAKLRRQSYQLWLPISRHTKKPSVSRCISSLIPKNTH